MTQTETLTIHTRLNGTATLAFDIRTQRFVWRNINGGRISRYWLTKDEALRFPPQ